MASWKACDMHDPIPLTVITGFLGSGKTTLLRNFLRQRGGSGIGVVVNELGEVGLDQDLLVHAAEHVELVAHGCMCCARRGDIAKALHDLIRRERRQGGSWIEEAITERSEEHTSELQSLMRISYAVFCCHNNRN